jgi:glyoxylase-like metal-dependent hydrolase (beta-lactamase superfamily II)
MKFWQKSILFVITLAMIAYAGLGLAQAQTPNKLTLASAGLSLEKVGLGVYALVSSTDFPPADAAKIAICNGGIILSDEGTILIDPFQNKALGKLMLETAKSLSQEPIRYVINSHFHFDHTGGNAAIAAENIPLIGRGQIRSLMLTRNTDRDPTLTPPSIIIDNATSLWLGDRQIKIIPTEGHTPGTDVLVYVPDADILFTGDIVFNQRIPYVADGDIRKWQASLQELLRQYPEAKIVPGHGSVSDRQIVVQQQAYFDNLEELALGWKKAEISQEQALKEAEKVPSQYSNYGFQALYSSNLETAYQQITQASGQ